MNDAISVKPERPGGFLDYLPADFLAREKLLNTVTKVFRSFGFDPIETPRVEFLKTLAGETSDTGKNIFHIQGSRDDEPLALPFDHTVPLARLLAANPFDPRRRSGIRLPWRRMVVGPVFRADTPQAGRFRQFYQFDADIAGTASMMADAEIVAVICRTMEALDIRNFKVRLNNRKILNGLSAAAEIAPRPDVPMEDRVREMMRILDKLDKIGRKQVMAELCAEPESELDPRPFLSETGARKVAAFLDITGDNAARLSGCREIFAGVDQAMEGIDELEQVLTYTDAMGVKEENLAVDFSIARGLDYYTGPVMETVLLDAPKFGSVFGGGRYNNLVARFTGQELPATGASMGVDRFYSALQHIQRKNKEARPQTVSAVMVLRIHKGKDAEYMKMVTRIRNAGVNAEVCLVEDTTFKSQFNFAINRGVKFVVICGENEFEKKTVQVKNLETRHQEEIPLAHLGACFKGMSTDN